MLYNGKLFPELSGLLTIFQSADASEEARNTQKLSELEMRAVSTNSRLRAALRTRRVGLTSYSWDIVGASSKDADEATETKQRLQTHIKKVLRQYYLTSTFGALAIEQKWINDGYWYPQIVKRYKPNEVNWNANPEMLGTWKNGKPALLTSTVNNREQLILCSDETFEAGGDLRPTLIGQILRNDQMQEWANFNNKLKGLINMQINDSSNAEDVNAARTAMAELYLNNAAITGPETTMNFVETVSSLGSSSFKEFIAQIDTDAQIGLVGQANTAELPDRGGCRAAIAVQNMITADISFEDMITCEDMINEQILLPYYRKNKNAKGFPPYSFQFIWQEDAPQEARVNTIVTMLDGGLPVIANEAYALAGMTKPSMVPEVIMPGVSFDVSNPQNTNGGASE